MEDLPAAYFSLCNGLHFFLREFVCAQCLPRYGVFFHTLSSPTLPSTDFEYSSVQHRAVTAPIGPVLVLAGPGSGKTRCLTGRIGHLLDTHSVIPGRICAVTFTNKASGEIQSRLRAQHGTLVEELCLGTIHSLCLKILRPHARLVGLVTGFGVADEDARALILRRKRVFHKRVRRLLGEFSKRRFGRTTLSAEDEALYHGYCAELREAKLIDFDEILFLTQKLLESSERVAEETRGLWDHILVDECQDLNPTQYDIVARLAAKHRSVFLVGDDEQSIYAFSGADPQVVHRYMTEFGIGVPLQLDRNHRCSRAIFETARRILPPTTLFECRDIAATRESSFAVEVSGHATVDAEIEGVVRHLQEDRRTCGVNYREYAILYRTHIRGRALEQALMAVGIPCRLAEGRSMSDNAVVAQVAASLRLMLEPKSDFALHRLADLVLGERLTGVVLGNSHFEVESKLRKHGAVAGGDDGRKVRRLLNQASNIRALAGAGLELGAVVESILALGIGERQSPLEDLLGKLADPMEIAEARMLHDRLDAAEKAGTAVRVDAAAPLAIVLREFLRQVLPQLIVVDTASATADELVLAFPESADPSRQYQDGAQRSILMLFAALKIREARTQVPLFREYVVFDTETTEKDVDQCEVVDLAAVRVRDGVIVEEYQTLVRCSRPITKGATQTHGYVDADLVGASTLQEVWPAFRTFVGSSLLIAHNGYNFDVPVLERLTAEWNGFDALVCYDSFSFARHVVRDGSLALQVLAEKFHVGSGSAHHALDDCRCLYGVFEALQQLHLANGRKLAMSNRLDFLTVALALAGPAPSDGVGLEVFGIGARRALGRYSSVLDFYGEELARHGIVGPSVAELIDRLGGQDLMDRMRREKTVEDRHPEEVAWLQSMVKSANDGGLDADARHFLDRLLLSKLSDGVADLDRVSLLTFHATKGLEFSRVYVTGVEDSILPGFRQLDQNIAVEIDESRRLLYVAMTRAKDRLCLSYSAPAAHRPHGGRRFLFDLGLLAPPAGHGQTVPNT